MSDYEAGTIVPRYAPRPKPTPIPEASAFDLPLKCLAVNEFWVAHILGVMEALDQFDTWIGTPEEVEAARDQVNEIMAAWADDCDPCVTPTGDPPFRVNGFGMTEQLSNGEWIPPSGDYAFPPVPAREELTVQERKCLAAANAVNALETLYEAVTDQYAEEVSPELGILALLIAAGAVFAFPFAPILAGVLLFLELPFQVFYFLVEQVGSDLWDADFTEKLTCVLLRNAVDTDGVVHFDLENIVTELGAGINLFDPDADDLRLFGQVDFLLRSLGNQALDHAGTSTAITDYDCDPCGATWTYLWDFSEGLGNWSIVSGQPGAVAECGFEVGTTFAEANPARPRMQAILEYIGFPGDAQLRQILFEYHVDAVYADLGYPNSGIYGTADVLLASGIPSVGDHNDAATGEYTGTTKITYFFGLGACDFCGGIGSAGCIKTARVSGIGDPPTVFTGGTFI